MPPSCLRRRRPVPPEIAADLDLVRRLPVLARQQLYHVLGPCLVEPVPMIEDELDRFCTSHQVAGADLARAIKACRFLLRSAATANLPAAAFLEDLTALRDAGELREALMSGYDQALNVVNDARSSARRCTITASSWSASRGGWTWSPCRTWETGSGFR